MKKNKFYKILLISFLILTNQAFSQHPPCKPEEQNLTVEFPRLTTFPMYSTGMPYDVLIGYIALDTIAYHSNKLDYYNFIERQTFNDTLQKIMRYYYEISDYNPILFAQSIRYWDSLIQVTPLEMQKYFNEKVGKVSPTPYLDRALLEHEYILHISVTDTLYNQIPDYPGASSEIYNITATVLDTIKGRVFPSCKTLTVMPDSSYGELQEFPSSCVQFLYSPAWGFWKGHSMHRIEDDNGNAWVKKNKEYIVFINLGIVCTTPTNDYYTMSPLGLPYKSYTFLMFPIENGIVIDPGNEFGFGYNLTVQQWKTALRNRINTIINY